MPFLNKGTSATLLCPKSSVNLGVTSNAVFPSALFSIQKSVNITLPYNLYLLNVALALTYMMVIAVRVRGAHSVSAHAI